MVERFIRILSDECLDVFWFKDPENLQRKLSEYRRQYNVDRYHSKLGMTPAHLHREQNKPKSKTKAELGQ